MGWWPKRKRGRHAASPPAGRFGNGHMERATEDLREAILRRPVVDNLVIEIRRTWRANQ